MSRFKNKLCPVCRIAFNEDEDIVVCPDCGTPHHRECYMKIGHCGIEEYHAKGFVWNGLLPDQTKEQASASTAQSEQAANNETAQHAENHTVAQPMHADTQNSHHAELPPMGENSELPEMESLKDINPYFDMYKKIRELTDDEKRGDDGVSSKELCHFAGKSILHYSQAFAAFRVGVFKNGHIQPVKMFLNLCSGLFAPIHQFYRRMDFLAISLLLVSAITSIPDCMLVFDHQSTAFQFSENTLSALNRLSALCSFINFAITMLLCVFGDYLYYKFCVRRIKKIRAAYDDGNAAGYYAALTASGMPSKLRIVIGILATMLISQIVYVAPSLILV